MAGSFRHVHDPDSPQGFRFDLIDDLGDAYEACEDMHMMILLLARGDAELLRRVEAQTFAIGRGEEELPADYVVRFGDDD